MTRRRAGVPLALKEWRSVVLLAAAEELLAVLERELEPVGLSWRTCRILALIGRLQPVSQIAVAERLGIDRTTMSETARELSDLELVYLLPLDWDRRRRQLQLTIARRAGAGACRIRGRTGGGGAVRAAWACALPPPGGLSDAHRAAADLALDRRDRVVLRRPGADLGVRELESPHQLGAQVLGLDHRVHHQLGGQVEHVDLLGELAP